MKTTLELLAEKHTTWFNIVKSFGCNQDTAEDIVQEMYIKIHILISKGTNVMYNETEINHFYIFRTLRSLFIDLTRKQNKVKIVDIDWIDKNSLQIPAFEELDNIGEFYRLVNSSLDKLHWYDKKIYQYIEGGESIKGLSDKTKISYYSVYNTYNKVKKKLEKLIIKNLKKDI